MNEKTGINIQSLLDELMYTILQCLSLKNLGNVAMVNKKLHNMIWQNESMGVIKSGKYANHANHKRKFDRILELFEDGSKTIKYIDMAKGISQFRSLMDGGHYKKPRKLSRRREDLIVSGHELDINSNDDMFWLLCECIKGNSVTDIILMQKILKLSL